MQEGIVASDGVSSSQLSSLEVNAYADLGIDRLWAEPPPTLLLMAHDSSWGPMDLTATLADEGGDPGPTRMARTDGVSLVYDGKMHWLFGEPESLKGWFALVTAREYLAAGEHVLYVDFEDGPATVVERLRALGVGDKAIQSRFHYVRPEEPLDERGEAAVGPAATVSGLVVLDGVTEALALHGIDMNSNVEVARFLSGLPRRSAQAGAAVILIDHVTKDRESRGGSRSAPRSS